MKIGIFGGSFNPPHKMHKDIACNLIKYGYLDRIIYVPTGNKYNKKELISADKRYNMLKLMVQDNLNLDVSDYEIKNSLTYTYQTLDYFKNKFKCDDIYFICGSDNLKELNTWKRYDYILDNYRLLVINRNNDNIYELINNYNKENIAVADIPLSNISSSFIRNEIRCGNLNSIESILSKEVLKYIEENKLYYS